MPDAASKLGKGRVAIDAAAKGSWLVIRPAPFVGELSRPEADRMGECSCVLTPRSYHTDLCRDPARRGFSSEFS